MTTILLAIATAFAGMGTVALSQPASIGRYIEVRIESGDARNEIRAVYGGFGWAMAGALVLALVSPPLRRGIVACVALALAGMAGGRVAGALVERPGFWPRVFFGVEAGAAVALGWVLVGGPG